MWSFLKSSKFYGFKFRRQFSIDDYIVDLCCVKAKLVIELDGGQHSNPDDRNYDIIRDAEIKVPRSRADEVLLQGNNYHFGAELRGIEPVLRLLGLGILSRRGGIIFSRSTLRIKVANKKIRVSDFKNLEQSA